MQFRFCMPSRTILGKHFSLVATLEQGTLLASFSIKDLFFQMNLCFHKLELWQMKSCLQGTFPSVPVQNTRFIFDMDNLFKYYRCRDSHQELNTVEGGMSTAQQKTIHFLKNTEILV